MTRKHRRTWPWHLLTGLILALTAWGLWYSTSLISYEWRWNRVPQYFVYQAEESQRAADYGRVESIAVEAPNARRATMPARYRSTRARRHWAMPSR